MEAQNTRLSSFSKVPLIDLVRIALDGLVDERAGMEEKSEVLSWDRMA